MSKFSKGPKGPNSDQEAVLKLFKLIMSRCRAERKQKANTTVRELARRLGKTENYVSSVENGREFPSLKTFLHYLLINRFDVAPLEGLSIMEETASHPNARKMLVEAIYSLDSDEVSYLYEQAKLTMQYNLKSKKKNNK